MHLPLGVPRVNLCVSFPWPFCAQGRDFIILPRLRLPPTQSVADKFGRMDEAQAREVDNHTKASESLHDAPDPVANATTTWGMYNTTCHRQQPAAVNDRPTGASSAIAEAANGDREAIEPQGKVTPPTPFGEPLPPCRHDESHSRQNLS